jgi:hypothetical protein
MEEVEKVEAVAVHERKCQGECEADPQYQPETRQDVNDVREL